MTKKKQRVKLARALRAAGFKGARAFNVARAVVSAGSPTEIPALKLEELGLTSRKGGWDPNRGSWMPSDVFCTETGACVLTAWHCRH
jgi:hypothetical protein